MMETSADIDSENTDCESG